MLLDHAAGSPVLPEAVEVVCGLLGTVGSPEQAGGAGRRAAAVVEHARATVAGALGAAHDEVVLTGGGTEGDNLAVKGLYWAQRQQDPARTRVLVGAAEHQAVLGAADWLAAASQARVERLPVDDVGRVAVDTVRAALAGGGADVALVSLSLANNEVGTVQALDEVVELAHAAGARVHTDAVQAVGQLPVDFSRLGVDALTVSGHKYGAPPGTGALLLREGVACRSLLHGGAGRTPADRLRPGPLSPALAAGFAVATASVVEQQPAHAVRLRSLRDQLVHRVQEAVPGARLRGDPVDRLPGNAHLTFAGCEGDSLVLLLDARGVLVSTGSACSAGVPRPSHVLLAMGVPEDEARSSLRFSLGHGSTGADVDALVAVLPAVVERARSAGWR
ncbi:MAG: Cysteine desulfurase [uncultured Frankineae bacterium]|uniref:cysteine desulfurase n=1 Tax=uncultured Frankineae bacterium TaxID=437475 RepID=A0A6J4LF15_9ACTN|nr:MAG: Cysteine desulfurase [uncultured Frankineae bacterium]